MAGLGKLLPERLVEYQAAVEELSG